MDQNVEPQLLIIFILIHLAGNSTIYFGWINAYAEHLHSLPPVVWIGANASEPRRRSIRNAER